VRLDTELLGMSRDEFVSALAQQNIGTGLHFPAIHLKKYYRERYGYTVADCPHAVAQGASIVSLPLYPGLMDSDIDDVVSAITKVTARTNPFSG
jgi:UDP-4-amino-4-deoxy-L-arabinose-oxoglutarate aminotransferase